MYLMMSQIYVTTGEVFSLEEHIQKLKAQLLATDEFTSYDVMDLLEEQIALAIAKVAHSDLEVHCTHNALASNKLTNLSVLHIFLY
jgi:hypothetical protein